MIPNSLPKLTEYQNLLPNSGIQSSNLAEDLDIDDAQFEVKHYFESASEEKFHIKTININDSPEKIVALAHEKRFIFMKNNVNDVEFHVNPMYEEKLKKAKQIIIEDATGQVKKVILNDGIGHSITFKALSPAEMRAIEKIHDVALRILQDRKKKNETQNEATPPPDSPRNLTH